MNHNYLFKQTIIPTIFQSVFKEYVGCELWSSDRLFFGNIKYIQNKQRYRKIIVFQLIVKKIR